MSSIKLTYLLGLAERLATSTAPACVRCITPEISTRIVSQTDLTADMGPFESPVALARFDKC